MEEKNIMEDYQKKTKSPSLWDSKKFAELMDYSAVEAAKYAIDCGIDTEIMGMPVKDYVACNGVMDNAPKNLMIGEEAGHMTLGEGHKELSADEEVVEADEVTEDVKVEEVTEENSELNKEQIQELLAANGVEFKFTLWTKKLLEIAKENNLL